MRFKPQPVYKWITETPDDPPWLVPKLIPVEAVVRVSGPRKRGRKSYLMGVISTLLATGLKLGEIKPIQAEPVLYVQEEGPRGMTRDRLEKTWRGLGLKPDATLLKDFWWAHRTGIKIDNKLHVQKLREFLRATGVKMVVLDAITYMHNGDENSNRDMGRVVDGINDIRSDGVTVVYIAHTKKAIGEGADIDNEARGASIMSDGYDAHLALRLDPVTRALVLHTRFRDAEEASYRLGWTFDADSAKLKFTLRTENSYLYEVVDLLVEEGGMIPGEKYSFTHFRQLVGMDLGPAMSLRAKLLESGLIERPRDGKGIIVS